jgi:predicted nucleic acid-binding protein
VKNVVLDASAALQLIIPDTATAFDAASALFADIAAERLKAHVPVIFFNEVAAAITRAVRGKRITKPQAESFFAVAGAAPLALQIEVLAIGDWYERAMRWGCQVADSAYLSLALGLGAPIATTDRGLMTAARSNKAKLHWPDSTVST